jgi:protein-L-isoaspartate(D-aspartate) O-methyltransferase
MSSSPSVQRRNMVEAQIRANDVTDPRIQAAMAAVPRERFVPPAKRALAYADIPVEVAPDRYLLDPRTLAKLLELADLRATDNVLDVGSATGYSAAVIAHLAKSVFALEQDAELARSASELLSALGNRNVEVIRGALPEGYRLRAPFDAILLNGAVPEPPEALLEQLADGGRLVAVVANGEVSKAQLFVRDQGRIGCRSGFDANVPMLVGFSKSVGFVF